MYKKYIIYRISYKIKITKYLILKLILTKNKFNIPNIINKNYII